MLEIYTKPNCPVCNNTKVLLNSNNVEFVEYQIGQDIMRDDVLSRFPDVKSVPIIILNGNRIGGFSDLQLLLEKEKPFRETTLLKELVGE